MYEVSDAYKEAMKAPVQHFRLRGTLQIGARELSFTEENIAKNSFNYSHQCSGSDNVEIGTVYTAEVSVTFIGLSIPRGNLDSGILTPQLSRLTSDGWEPVPLGIFYVNEANWNTSGLEITSYDGMSKFEKTLALKSSTGTIFDFLTLACNACGVELGMTRAEVQTFVNGSAEFTVYEENDMETWRDLVAWCAQTAGAFATVDRTGKLILRAYTTDAVDTISASHRLTGAKFSDFVTRYTGVSLTSTSEQTTKYYGLQPDDGLTYNLGQNPFLQYGLAEAKEAYSRAILSALAVIAYTPMEVSMIGDPVYDIGDAIKFTEGAAGDEVLSCITAVDWTFGGEYQITGVGENPALSSARSKVDKNIAGLLSETNQDVVHYYDYINAKEIHVGDGDRGELISFRYATTKITHVDFHAEIKYKLSTTETDEDDVYTENDGVLTLTYILNGEEVVDYYPVETKTDGTHLLHLLFTWSATANVIGTFVVYVDMKGGEIDVGVGEIRAYLAGQGLVGDDAWDGNISVSDNVAPFDMTLVYPDFTDSQTTELVAVTRSGLSDNVSPLDMTFVLGKFTDHLGTTAMLHRFTVAYNAADMTYDGVAADTDKGVWKLTDDVSQGTLTTPDCEATQIVKVTVVDSGADVSYIVSFDAGETWRTYSDGWVEPDYTQDVYGMFDSTLEAITTDQWAEKLDGSIMIRAILVESATVTNIQIYTEEIAR